MKILIDSSVLIEFEKGKNLLYSEIVEATIHHLDLELYLSGTILNEYLYHFVGIFHGLSPRTIKEKSKIEEALAKELYKKTISPLHFLSDSAEIVDLVPALMSKYNLLPSDAQILSICKIHNIKALASLDIDFTVACQSESIQLINDKQTLYDFITK